MKNTWDKISVAPHQITDYDLDIQEVGHNGAEEYVRKEALIEWAENWGKYKLRTDDGFLYAMELLVQHLESM